VAAARTIYFDISDLIAHAPVNATLSGIQRVIVMVLTKLVNSDLDYNIALLSYNRSSGDITSYSAGFFKGNFTYDQDDFCAYFRVKQKSGRSQHNDLNYYIRKKYGASFKGKFHLYRLMLLNIFSRGRKFSRLGVISRSRRSHTHLKGNPGKPAVAAGDIICLPGATWGMDPLLTFLSDARRKGATIVPFVYDLVPLVAPEHVLDGVSRRYFDWLSKMADISHAFIVDSECTRADLLKFISEQKKTEKPIHVVCLAHQFASSARVIYSGITNFKFSSINEYDVSSSVYNAARLPYVLCVGTLESRKNIFTLARVWQYLEKELELDTPRLIFAGRSGWLREDFDAFLRSSGHCGGLIQIVESPFDHELEYLYRNCLFTVYPSYYEGWGLPVGESLWLGKPVVASNSSSIPEVAGPLADYVDPFDGEQIKTAIKKLITDEPYRKHRCSDIAQAQLRNWDDVASDQMKAILQIADAPPDNG
jgi:glycosyltransferase involved in cell wall biosynthesis